MSYFDSLLSSVGVDVPSNPAQTSRPPKPVSRLQNSATSVTNNDSPMLKRKADEQLTNDAPKAQRISDGPIRPDVKPPVRPVSAGPSLASAPKPPPSVPSSKPREGPAASKNVSAKPLVAKPMIPGSKPALPPQVKKPATPIAAAPPAKGSYAEIMARAKALQSTSLGAGARIMNKSIAKSKDEKGISHRKRTAETRKPATKKARSQGNSRAGSEDVRPAKPAKKASIAPVKPKRKPIDIGYKGTMRPGQTSTFKGTANTSAGLKREDGRSKGSGYSSDRYGRARSVSFDEDEEEDGYESYASSDMEAGAFDIDQEEELALRAARKEDAEALREEEEAKRRKAIRKQTGIQGRRY